ncbi:MAG TPA: PKD domain-containing protein [Thermoplasmata archaeon]|nr:PKD domain-containing protein [Thermoplasmata archaeon]
MTPHGVERTIVALLAFVIFAVSICGGTRPASGAHPIRPFDSQPPIVDFRIRDPRNGWAETFSLIEGQPYGFDATGTRDDSLNRTQDNVNLTYRWDFGDGVILGPGLGGPPDFLINVSHAYGRWGPGYRLNLTVRDQSGNPGAEVRTLVVQANATAHPDLSVVPGTLRFLPPNPVEGQDVIVRVEVRNARGKAPAADVRAELTMSRGNVDVNQTISAFRLLDAGGAPISVLPPDANATAEFGWRAPGVGRYTLTARIFDGNEPAPWISTANQDSATLGVAADLNAFAMRFLAITVLGTVAGAVGVVFLLARRGRRPV